MRKGWIKLPEEERKEREKKKEKKYYMIWTDEDQLSKEARMRKKMHIDAPKVRMPGHAESYNPPAEYLMSKDELEAWKEMDPQERKQNFIPQKYGSMREVPRYADDVKERFERCLDLYLCPRQVIRRRKIQAEKLLPQVPKPQDLRPFPTRLAITYEGHTERVRGPFFFCSSFFRKMINLLQSGISVSPSGEFMASASEDKTVKVWEVETGRCMQTFDFDEIVQAVAWNPNPAIPVLAVAVERAIHLIDPLLSSSATQITQKMFAGASKDLRWTKAADEEWQRGWRVSINIEVLSTVLKWHPKGDYLVSVAPKSKTGGVMIHR